MTCEQCKYITACMAAADYLGQVFDPSYDGEHGCTDFAPCTNADRIRSMSDEELVKLLDYELGCPVTGDCAKMSKDCKACWLDWLQQPAEGE